MMENNRSTNFFNAKRDFKALSTPNQLPNGLFQIHWIGPRWFQNVAKLGLGFFGFKYWHGKQFYGNEEAINIFLDPNTKNLVSKYPMQIKIVPSSIDGKDCLQVSYPKNTRFPWSYVIDEFRYWDANTLLGQSYVKFFPFIPLPFFLQNKE